MNKKITNRELLRNYKNIRVELMSGEVDEVEVMQKDGSFISIVHIKEKTPFQKMRDYVKDNPIKSIKRPEEDLFDL